jgi:SAM-dependent methyltransferase
MPVNGTRAKKRDADEFDTTSLRAGGGAARTLHRDYSAHFFRWSFARRLIKKTDHVLDLGCGVDQPLKRVLLEAAGGALCASYCGVDLNPLKASGNQHVLLFGETDFTSPAGYKKVMTQGQSDVGFDVVVHLEIIEHMPVEAGKRLLKHAYQALKPGGLMLMSTPVYDGKHHAANHIHEYTVPELEAAVRKAKFTVERRFGTFMDVKHIGKANSGNGACSTPELVALDAAIKVVKPALAEYFDNDALSNIFGPLYPDHARNNLWVCRK